MQWIDQWLNKDEVKEALGVPMERNFESECLSSRSLSLQIANPLSRLQYASQPGILLPG